MSLLDKLDNLDKDAWEDVINRSELLDSVKLSPKCPAYGYLSKELVNQIIIQSMKKIIPDPEIDYVRGKPTHLFISGAAFDQLVNWSDKDSHEISVQSTGTDTFPLTVLKLPDYIDPNKVFAFDFSKEDDEDCMLSLIVGELK